MSFNYNGRQFAEVEIGRVYGEPGLGHFRLMVELRWRMREWADENRPTLLEVGGSVTLQDAERRQHRVGALVATDRPALLRAESHSHGNTTRHEIELDRGRLEALEAVRLGGDVVLKIDVWAVIDGDVGQQATNESLSTVVEQGSWVRILEQMQYQRTLLLEVAVPEAPAPAGLSDAVAHIAKSQAALVRGECREAVAQIRGVMESLATVHGETGKAAQFQRQDDKKTRLRMLREALQHFTHPAHHAAGEEFDRSDAVLALAVAAALMQHNGDGGGTREATAL